MLISPPKLRQSSVARYSVMCFPCRLFAECRIKRFTDPHFPIIKDGGRPRLRRLMLTRGPSSSSNSMASFNASQIIRESMRSQFRTLPRIDNRVSFALLRCAVSSCLEAKVGIPPGMGDPSLDGISVAKDVPYVLATSRRSPGTLEAADSAGFATFNRLFMRNSTPPSPKNGLASPKHGHVAYNLLHRPTRYAFINRFYRTV